MSAIPRSFTILATNSSAADPFTAVSFKASGGIFYGANSQTITGDANGAWAVAANGTNQSITLTPSGTGGVTLTGAGSATLGLLRLPAATTMAQGISFGGNVFLHQLDSGSVYLLGTAVATNLNFYMKVQSGKEGGIVFTNTGVMNFLTNAGTQALGLDASQNATLVGNLTMTALKQVKFGATANATIGVSADTTAGVLTFTAPSAGSLAFAGGTGINTTVSAAGLWSITGNGGPILQLTRASGTADARIQATTADGVVSEFGARGAGSSPASNAYFQSQTNHPLTLGVNNTAVLTFSTTLGTITGGAQSMVITSGTGNSRTMTLQTTTSGGTATNAIVINDVQNSAFNGSITAVNLATASAPAYAKGVIYFDTTLNKLRVGGAAAFETITSA